MLERERETERQRQTETDRQTETGKNITSLAKVITELS